MIERMRVAISLRDVASYRATRHTLRVLRVRARVRCRSDSGAQARVIPGDVYGDNNCENVTRRHDAPDIERSRL